jgi:tetratricopeptide (TPR) repeat protein
MSFRLREIIKDPDKRAILSWLGAGIVVAASGIWAVFTFVVEHKAGHDQRPSKELVEQIQKPLAEQLAAQNALIKLLLEKNPAAAPGAQQAVGAAVGSIAQGAAEGDARLQQALDLLKANKIADATQLLKLVAEDKTARAGQETARAEKDRKEAAIAYRNLGAIAALVDPKRALEAYEKALALDPDDLQSLVVSGVIRIIYGDLNKAQTRLERVLKLTESGDQAFYDVQTPGEFGGLGVEVTQEEGLIKVVTPIGPGLPCRYIIW